MPTTLEFADRAARDDLRTYVERLLRVGKSEVRLVQRGRVLAVFGCTQAPAGLLDQVPVVLVLRSFALSTAVPDRPDLVVTGRSLLDRLARTDPLGVRLELPEVETTAAWAGVLPPVSGWRAEGTVDASSLSAVAADGMRRIADALPESPGEAVVRTVRRTVWGSEIAPGLPAAAAFAAESMGFLGGDGPMRMSSTLTWRRITGDRGEVLVRTLLG